LEGQFDIIFQNPPFGAQDRGADLPFIEAALRCAKVTYSIHNGSTSEFLTKKIAQLGGKVEYRFKDRLTIPHMFDFHMKERQDIEVVVLKMTK
jgi:putative methylase